MWLKTSICKYGQLQNVLTQSAPHSTGGQMTLSTERLKASKGTGPLAWLCPGLTVPQAFACLTSEARFLREQACLPLIMNFIWNDFWFLLYLCLFCFYFFLTLTFLFCTGVVQSPSHVWLFAAACTVACQASLSLTISQSLPKLVSMANAKCPGISHDALCIEVK